MPTLVRAHIRAAVKADVAPVLTAGAAAAAAKLPAGFASNAYVAAAAALDAAVVITFAGRPAGAILPPTASVTLLDTTHGWARPVWVAAGMPEYPSAVEIEAELEASTLVPVSVPLVPAGAGALSVSFPDLEPYAVARLVIKFAVPGAL